MDEDRPSRDSIEQLVARLESLERELRQQTRRLAAVERHLGVEPAPPPRPPAPPPREAPAAPAPDAHTHAPPPDAPAPQTQDQPPRTNGRPFEPGPDFSVYGRRAEARPREEPRREEAPRAETAPAGATPPRRDLEAVIGGRAFAWAGILAVAFAAAFFLKLAFESGYISPTVRVLFGAAAGLALLGAGELLRGRGLRHYAFVISGGGVLILYLSIYAAFNFYQLVAQTTAFALMAGVTAAAVLLSVRLDALPVAVLGLVGGFLTPILLSTGQDNQVGLFTYVALLDAGVLALAYFKRWRSLNFLSFAATALTTLGWAVAHYAREKLWLTVFFISVFFLLYALLAVAHNILPRRPARWYDLLLAGANATLYFGLSYLLLSDAGYEFAPASQALLVSALYAALFYAVFRLHRADRLLAYGFVGAAVTFFSVAVAVRLELHLVTIAWAVEALMLTWAGLRAEEPAVRRAALPVFLVAAQHWVAFDALEFAFDAGHQITPLLNRRALSCAVLVGTLAAAAYLYRRGAAVGQGGVAEQERGITQSFLLLAASVLALLLLTLDVNDYFRARLASAEAARAQVEITRQFTLTVLWAVYGAALLVAGLVRRLLALRGVALLVLAGALAKLVAVDSGYYADPGHPLLVNQTFMAYALLTLALAVSARFYRRAAAGVREEELRVVYPALASAAGALGLAGLSLEAYGYYERLRPPTSGEEFARLGEGQAFALTFVWVVYGACLFLYGARREGRAWRLAGLLVLGVASAKALVWDVTYCDAAWHAPVFNRTLAAFALLVGAGWLVAREYARGGERFAEGGRVRPLVAVSAHVLAVVALSAEAGGHFQARINAGGHTDEAVRDLNLAQQLSLSLVWAVYGAGLFAAGRVLRSRLLRLMALVLLALTTLKVFFWDLSSLERTYRIVSFVVLGLILLAVSFLYQRSQQRAAEDEAAG